MCSSMAIQTRCETVPPGKLEIHLAIKNTGQTPACDVTHWVNVWIGGEPAEFKPPKERPDVVSTLYLPAGAVVPLITTCSTPWSRAVFDMPLGDNDDDVCLYVWGEARYTDVFDKTHFLKFRFKKEPGIGRPGLDYCPLGNEGD
jgi:hypothetical protein